MGKALVPKLVDVVSDVDETKGVTSVGIECPFKDVKFVIVPSLKLLTPDA